MLVNKNICKHNLRNIPIRALAGKKKKEEEKYPYRSPALCGTFWLHVFILFQTTF